MKRKVYCILGCSELGAYMHQFPHPVRRAESFKAWLAIVGNKLKESDPLKIYKNKRICDYHFKPEHKVTSHRLSNCAVPSLHMIGVVSAQGISVQLEHNYTLPRMWISDYEPGPNVDVESAQKQHSTDDDHEMDITENDVEDLRFNNLHLKVTQVLDADDKWGELRLDYLSKNIRVPENENALLGCDKSGINAPANDDCNLKTLKEININGEIVPIMKKEMEPVTSINSEDFREDGVGEHNVPQERNVPQEHQGFCCNVCLGKIVGFRYRCCECVDYDMCSDCEYRGEHPLHYVLRVPGYRKQCEVRRVMAAVHLALAPPTDVKDELTIKIEDPEEDPPPDPLDTEEAVPADPEQMENESTQTPLYCTDVIPPPAKVPRVEPNKRSKLLLKLARTNKTNIAVALDALKRKAIVTLHKLKLPLQENTAQTESLDEDTQRKHITNTYSTSVTKKETIEKVLEYTHDSSLTTLQNIDHIIPTKQSPEQYLQSKRKLKPIDLLQTSSQEVKIIPQYISAGSENKL